MQHEFPITKGFDGTVFAFLSAEGKGENGEGLAGLKRGRGGGGGRSKEQGEKNKMLHEISHGVPVGPATGGRMRPHGLRAPEGASDGTCDQSSRKPGRTQESSKPLESVHIGSGCLIFW